MTASAPAAGQGRAFLIACFVVAAIVGVVVAYLGITGRLGGPIP